MSTHTQQFLICLDDEHAGFIDSLIMDRLRDVDGTKGASWSGIFYEEATDRFAVLWGSPASGLFGTPDIDPDLVLVEGEMIRRDDEGAIISGTWDRYVPPAPDPIDLI